MENEIEQINFEAERDLNPLETKQLLEALIFASGEPISKERLLEVSGLEEQVVSELLEQLMEQSQHSTNGFILTHVANKYQFRTLPQFAPYLQVLKADRPRRLSQAALETLAIVAYRQPVVKSDIEKIRGVDVTPTLKTLLERGLVKILGYQPTVGQPAMYGTTEEFLKLFGLSSLSELPALRDLRELERDPGEPDEVETAITPQEEEAETPLVANT